MPIKVLFTYDYGKEKMDMIEKLGYEVIVKHENGLTVNEEIDDAGGVGGDVFSGFRNGLFHLGQHLEPGFLGPHQSFLEYRQRQ